MGNIIQSPYELLYGKESCRFWTFDEAKKQYRTLKGEGPCLNYAKISFMNQILFESFPIIIDGVSVECYSNVTHEISVKPLPWCFTEGNDA